MLAPPPPVSDASPTVAGASVASSTSPLPACTWQPESGGNPSTVNPSSGAGGYYQIMPSTWAAYGGTGAPQNAPMSEQTAIAQKIYHSAGAKRLDQLLKRAGRDRERSLPELSALAESAFV